jgi:hypothetical protein
MGHKEHTLEDGFPAVELDLVQGLPEPLRIHELEADVPPGVVDVAGGLQEVIHEGLLAQRWLVPEHLHAGLVIDLDVGWHAQALQDLDVAAPVEVLVARVEHLAPDHRDAGVPELRCGHLKLNLVGVDDQRPLHSHVHQARDVLVQVLWRVVLLGDEVDTEAVVLCRARPVLKGHGFWVSVGWGVAVLAVLVGVESMAATVTVTGVALAGVSCGRMEGRLQASKTNSKSTAMSTTDREFDIITPTTLHGDDDSSVGIVSLACDRHKRRGVYW